jgi:hypothetical protein
VKPFFTPTSKASIILESKESSKEQHYIKFFIQANIQVRNYHESFRGGGRLCAIRYPVVNTTRTIGTSLTIHLSTPFYTMAFPSPQSAEFYLSLAAIIPALAYPFFPQPRVGSLFALMATNMQLYLVTSFSYPESRPVYPIWLPGLLTFSLQITRGRRGLHRHRDSCLRPLFRIDALLVTAQISIAVWAYLADRPPLTWIWPPAGADAVATVFCLQTFAAVTFYHLDTIARGLQRISERRISCWTWLGIERTGTWDEVFGEKLLRAEEKGLHMDVFEPRWSVAVMYLTFITTVPLEVYFSVKWWMGH